MNLAATQVTLTNLEALEHIRRSWLSNFSHSLSGPLFTTRGYIRLVLQSDDGSLSASHREYLSRSLQTIDQLMLLARELNEFPMREDLELGPYSFRGALEEALTRTRALFAAGSVTLVQELPDERLATFSDRQAVLEALCGFLSAAAQFVESTGLVEVSALEGNGLIVFRLAAGPARRPELAPDLSAPSRLWRLQGGSISACVSDGSFLLTCELPLIGTTV